MRVAGQGRFHCRRGAALFVLVAVGIWRPVPPARATLISGQTASYFRVDGLLADGLGATEPEDGRVFRAEIRQTPLIEPRSRIARPPPRPPGSGGVAVSPRGRAYESLRAADVLAESQDWKRALATIQKALDQEPDNVLLIRRAAAYAAMARRFGVADEYFRRALEVAPADVPFLAGRAGILLRLLRLNESEELADRALALSPGYLAARFTRTCVEIARGDSELSDQAWKTMLTGEAAQLAEWLDADRADYTAALSVPGFEQLCDVVLGPGTSARLPEIVRTLKRAQSALRFSRWEEAQSVLEEAAGLGVQAAGINMDVARCRFELGDREGAVRQLSELAAAWPDLTLAQYNYAVALVRVERFEDARAVLERAHEKAPADPEVIFGLACTYAAKGDMGQAWRVLNRMPAEHRPKLREWTTGEESYIKAIREDPRFNAFLVVQAEAR